MSERKHPIYNKYKRDLYPGRGPIQQNLGQIDGSDTLSGEKKMENFVKFYLTNFLLCNFRCQSHCSFSCQFSWKC